MCVAIHSREMRTLEQLREHYEIEKNLANRLRYASREQRCKMYSTIYDELFRLVPHHPQLTQMDNIKSRLISVSRQTRFLKQFLNQRSTFLEVGPGDCYLSLNVANYARKVYAIDVSEEITKRLLYPENFKLIIYDGINIPIPADSINIAFSKELIEHLHPDDAFEHLKDIYNILIKGGKYIIITPNRLSGPHDISKYFDQVATGFHLKEYTITELFDCVREAGFMKIRTFIGGKGIYLRFPSFLIIQIEKLLSMLPYYLRKRIANTLPLKFLLGISMIATK